VQEREAHFNGEHDGVPSLPPSLGRRRRRHLHARAEGGAQAGRVPRARAAAGARRRGRHWAARRRGRHWAARAAAGRPAGTGTVSACAREGCRPPTAAPPPRQAVAAVTASLLLLAAALSVAALASGAVGGVTTYRGRRITVTNPFLASLLGSTPVGGDAPPTRVGYASVTKDGVEGSAATSALGKGPAAAGGWLAFALAASAAGALAAAAAVLLGCRGRPVAIAAPLTGLIVLVSAVAAHLVNVKTLAGGLRPVDAAGLATVSATQAPGPAFWCALAAGVALALAGLSAKGLPPRARGGGAGGEGEAAAIA